MGSELVAPKTKKRRVRPPKMGRPGLMTPEVQKRFLQELGRGCSIAHAARVSGLKPETVLRWVYRGQGKMAPERPATPEYVAFAEAVETAKAGLISELAGYAVTGAAKDPRLAIALLDRLDPSWSWAHARLPDYDPDEDDEPYLRPGGTHALTPPDEEPTEPEQVEETVTMRERTLTIPASRLDAFSRILRGKDPDVDAADARLSRFRETEDLPPT